MNDIKASRTELKFEHSLIESLNDRVKHLSILMKEMAEVFKPVNEQIQMFDDHTNEVQLTENIKVFYRYPLLSTFTKYASKTNTKLVGKRYVVLTVEDGNVTWNNIPELQEGSL